MGKKKSQKNDTNDEGDRQPQQDAQEQQQTIAEAEPDNEQAATGPCPVDDMSPEQLRAELASARAEIQQLKAELAAKSDRDAVKSSKPLEVQELQEKLAYLRKEQQAADAARDKAWKQLKSVVEEISSLANPDYLQSLQVRPID